MEVSISKAEVKSVIWRKINQMWQENWDREGKGRHLFQIQNSIRVNRAGMGRRREEVIMRLRLGHCTLNKSLKLVGKHQTGLCERCQEEEESVDHVLLRCRAYGAQREVMRNSLRELGAQEFNLKGVMEMSEKTRVRIVVKSLRETGLFGRI